MTAIGTPTESADALGLRSAPVGRRIAASAIDGAVILVGASPATAALVAMLLRVVETDPSAVLDVPSGDLILILVGSALSGAIALAQVIAHGARGRTLGRWLMGIRAVAVDGWGPPGVGWALLRALVLGASSVVVPIVGPAILLASPMWDREHRGRGLLDRIAREWSVDSRHGVDPFDKEAMRAARRAIREAPRRRIADARPMHSGGVRSALQVPTDRSSAGVVSAGAGTEWAPPASLAGDPVDADLAPARPASTSAPAPAPPAPTPAPAPIALTPDPLASTPGPRGVIRLRFDDGSSLVLRGGVLIGRAPAPEPGETVDELIALDDPSMQLSKTHALFALDGAVAVVVDRDSRNGVRVITAGGRDAIVAPRERTPLSPGSVVEVGGRRITIERTDSA